jgi:hypothetical protein
MRVPTASEMPRDASWRASNTAAVGTASGARFSPRRAACLVNYTFTVGFVGLQRVSLLHFFRANAASSTAFSRNIGALASLE